jgi:hypothetical protein
LSNIIINNEEKEDEKEDFFNSEFEEPDVNTVESDFRR